MSLNVLIVDDELDIRKAIIKSLKQSGLKLDAVIEAENGRMGLRYLDEHHFDLVLVDLNMPVMNGREFVAQMRKNPHYEKILVVFISGETDAEALQDIQQKGVGLIKKPFSPKLLGSMIVDLISSS